MGNRPQKNDQKANRHRPKPQNTINPTYSSQATIKASNFLNPSILDQSETRLIDLGWLLMVASRLAAHIMVDLNFSQRRFLVTDTTRT